MGRPASAARDDAPPEDPRDPQRVLGARGPLRVFNEAGVLAAADVHVAARLGELAGEADETVLLAVALAVRGVRNGSVCIDLATVAQADPALPWPAAGAWLDAVRASGLTGEGRPLRVEYDLLYLDRYHRQEVAVCADLLAREAGDPPAVDAGRLARALDRLFPDATGADGHAGDQRAAAALAVTRWTTIIGGGPGTGKTTTVARVLALLLDQPGTPPRVALAAPTGKAATRLQEAVRGVARELGPDDRHDLPTVTASTLHRLLGWKPGNRTRFRHDRWNRLPYDVVVVDETSMVSLTLMARLLDALRPDARLILLGDPDQLASVEAGAVLADLVGGLRARRDHAVAILGRTFRFGGAIADLAAAIRDGRADDALAVIQRGDPAVHLAPGAEAARADVVEAAAGITAAARAGDGAEALRRVDRHRLLCAHRTGPLGVQEWSGQIQRWLSAAELVDARVGEWYVGQPLLVTENDYALGLFNGDVGVVVADDEGGVRAVFAAADGAFRSFAPRRLGGVQTVHAMTVHRGQGSQFDAVTLVLPEADSPLCTRELVYTAVTRARRRVRVVGTEDQLRAAIDRPAARASGLRQRLRDAPG